VIVIVIAIAIIIGNRYKIWIYNLLKCVYNYICISLCKGKALIT
jgi:hypothetical protein